MKAILIAAALVLVGCVSKNVYPIQPMDRSQMTGTWFGLTGGDVHYYRLQLKENGTGVFGSSYWTNHPQIYRLNSWNLKGASLTVELHPLDPAYEPICIQGETVGQTIDLTVRGSTWKHVVNLRREDDFKESSERLRNAMLME